MSLTVNKLSRYNPSIISTTTRSLSSINTASINTTSTTVSSISKQFEFEMGYIIEDYITNGKDRFIQYIETHLKVSQEFIDTINNINKKQSINSHKMNEINVQNRIWRLLGYLLKSKTNPVINDNTDNNYYFNPSKFIRDECNNNYNIRKLDNIILWLQDIATKPNYLKKGDICYSRTINDDNNQSLDPDNLCNINKNDINDENKLLMNVFNLIRCGLFNKGIELCRNYGCFWRAASLNGKVLFNDKCNTENSIDSIIGNEEYLMWLRCCNSIAKKTKIGPEKWIYSSLCGNINELLTFITQKENWYDLLWIILICKKTYKQHQLLTNNLPSFYHNDLKNNKLNTNKQFSKLNVIDKIEWKQLFNDNNFNSIFEWIEKSNYSFNKNDINNRNITNNLEYKYNYQYYKICKFIICEQYQELIEDSLNFVETNDINLEISMDFMRFIIHLYLHLNPNIASSKNKDKKNQQNSIFTKFVKKYILKLEKNQYYDMITTYCYILPKQELISTLTEFLMKLNDAQLRIKLITKSKNILPPQIISKISGQIAKEIIDKEIDNLRYNNNDWEYIKLPIININNNDLHKIDSLKCLKIVNHNFDEILYRTNQLFIIFAKQYKFKSIQKLFDEINQIINNEKKFNNKLLSHFNTFKCFENYKLVIDSYIIWLKYKNNIENINIFKKYIKNMLLFNDGFLNPKYCSIQQLNFNQINQIRMIILKRLLIIICHQFIKDTTNQYQFCLELITIFANDKYKYYKLFQNENKNILKDLLYQAKQAKIQMIKNRQNH